MARLRSVLSPHCQRKAVHLTTKGSTRTRQEARCDSLRSMPITQANLISHHLPPMLFPWDSSCGQTHMNLASKDHRGPLAVEILRQGERAAYVTF